MKPSAVISAISSSLKHNLPLLIKGSPGIGKSDWVEQASKAEGIDLAIRHPVIEESIDYKGLPGFHEGVAKFMPFDDFHTLLTTDKPLAVFFDDLGQSSASTQAAIMQVILARQIGGKKVSPHVRFVAATNSRKDNAGVSNLITPLVSRFTVIEGEADANEWVKWALRAGQPTELCAFLRFKPALISTFAPASQKDITPFACPRSIATLGKWINAGVMDYPVWAGSVGEAFAIEFKAFYDTYKALSGLPDSVIASPMTAIIPDKPDVLYALSGALAHRSSDVSFPSICTYAKRLTDSGMREMETALIHECTTRKPDLKATRSYVEYASNNADVI